MNICVVCEYGWIIKGVNTEDKNSDNLRLTDAAVVRRWSNGKGIGGIAKMENKREYTLDKIGDVEINRNKILFVFPCEW